MLSGMIGEIEVSSDWFGYVLVIFFYVAKAFSESVAQSSFCFINVQLIAISGGTRKLITDLNVYFVYIMNERTSLAS